MKRKIARTARIGVGLAVVPYLIGFVANENRPFQKQTGFVRDYATGLLIVAGAAAWNWIERNSDEPKPVAS